MTPSSLIEVEKVMRGKRGEPLTVNLGIHFPPHPTHLTALPC